MTAKGTPADAPLSRRERLFLTVKRTARRAVARRRDATSKGAGAPSRLRYRSATRAADLRQRREHAGLKRHFAFHWRERAQPQFARLCKVAPRQTCPTWGPARATCLPPTAQPERPAWTARPAARHHMPARPARRVALSRSARRYPPQPARRSQCPEWRRGSAQPNDVSLPLEPGHVGPQKTERDRRR